jgi:hypothetical protein
VEQADPIAAKLNEILESATSLPRTPQYEYGIYFYLRIIKH